MFVWLLSTGTMDLVVLVAFSSWLAPALGKHLFSINVELLYVAFTPTHVSVQLLPFFSVAVVLFCVPPC